MLMKRDDSLLLIIDVQERLAPAMDSPREVITGCAKLIGVARRLGVPFIITEQYPKGLGPTMADLRQAAGDDAGYLSKTEFSCARNKEIMNNIKKSGKKQIIIAGIESHICVLQTAIALLNAGHKVFVVKDACASRDSDEFKAGIAYMKDAGAKIVTTEIALFELLKSSKHPMFKPVQNLIK